MKKLLLITALFALAAPCFAAAPTFKKLTLSDKFYAEGAYYGDFNKDGKMDVVIGPFWYEGPDFQKKHVVREEEKVFDPKGYSYNFLTFTADFNGDGWTDIFYVGFPGAEGFWYENPANKEGPWKKHLAFKVIDNESPMWGDINCDGRPELICNTGGQLGYCTWDPAKPDQEWVFHAVTPKAGYHKYTHGIGFGDVNGDGRMDMLENAGWWEQPANAKKDEPWIKHPYQFATDAAQMFAYDVDGDGLNDIVTAWHCHMYGLCWYKQVKNDKGEITFQQNVILPPKPDLQSPALRFSQPHAIDLVDMNGDGLKDILVGKRFWAHGPSGDAEPNAPAVVYWFELRRDAQKKVEFIPHLIDDNSGVGTQVAATDLNGDGVPDVIVGNKKGNFVFLSEKAK